MGANSIFSVAANSRLLSVVVIREERRPGRPEQEVEGRDGSEEPDRFEDQYREDPGRDQNGQTGTREEDTLNRAFNTSSSSEGHGPERPLGTGGTRQKILK